MKKSVYAWIDGVVEVEVKEPITHKAVQKAVEKQVNAFEVEVYNWEEEGKAK